MAKKVLQCAEHFYYSLLDPKLVNSYICSDVISWIGFMGLYSLQLFKSDSFPLYLYQIVLFKKNINSFTKISEILEHSLI